MPSVRGMKEVPGQSGSEWNSGGPSWDRMERGSLATEPQAEAATGDGRTMPRFPSGGAPERALTSAKVGQVQRATVEVGDHRCLGQSLPIAQRGDLLRR